MLLDQSYRMASQLGQALAAFIQSNPASTLLVASSDLSHFKPLAEAERLDKIMLDHIAAFDPEGIIRAEEEGRAFACGRGAMATVLVAARKLGATNVDIVHYGTSAEASGDTRQVVGYGAAVIYQS
jgi:AmmeMemoRadiSam system protein B